jgi:hypothetical protein
MSKFIDNRHWGRTGAALALLVIFESGCQTVRQGFWGMFGYEKRDLLVSDVKAARNQQQEASKEFKSALEQFQELTKTGGGPLEAKYKKLSAEYEGCRSRADAVHAKVAQVDKSAKALFSEWASESKKYENADLRAKSEKMLSDTQEKYKPMYASMKAAESKMDPVLRKFNDQVMFLKHNLNAQVVGQLQGTVTEIQSDVDVLVKEMETSIREADQFISDLNKMGQ